MTTINTDYHNNRIKYADLLYDNESMLPHRYVFVITNRCNLKCSFCFQERKKIPGSLDAEDWIKLIDQLPEYAHITLTGGEPFLCKGFKEIFLAATEKRTCNIISNGLLLDPELIDLLLSRENFKVLSISLDDVGNRNRDVPLEKWTRMVEMLHLFKDKRDKMKSKTVIDTKTVVLDTNAEDLFEIHKYCIEGLSSDTHTFMFLKGAPIQYSDIMFPEEAMYAPTQAYRYKKFDSILQQLEKVRQYNAANNTKCFTHPKVINLNSSYSLGDYDASYINEPRFNKNNFRKCKAPWESVHVNVDGNLFPCMAICMGNVKETPLKEIILGERFMRFKNAIKKEGTVSGCNRCGYLLPKPELVRE